MTGPIVDDPVDVKESAAGFSVVCEPCHLVGKALRTRDAALIAASRHAATKTHRRKLSDAAAAKPIAAVDLEPVGDYELTEERPANGGYVHVHVKGPNGTAATVSCSTVVNRRWWASTTVAEDSDFARAYAKALSRVAEILDKEKK